LLLQLLFFLKGKSNFFEKRIGEYAKAGVATSAASPQDNTRVFALDEDF
jgi:hypothetical protein